MKPKRELKNNRKRNKVKRKKENGMMLKKKKKKTNSWKNKRKVVMFIPICMSRFPILELTVENSLLFQSFLGTENGQ